MAAMEPKGGNQHSLKPSINRATRDVALQRYRLARSVPSLLYLKLAWWLLHSQQVPVDPQLLLQPLWDVP